MTKIKICGLTRPQDIAYVNETKPDYIGFILLFPKSRRNLTPVQAAVLRKELDPAIRAVGVFVNQPAGTVLEAAQSAGLDVIQLHGQEDAAYIRGIQHASGLPVWKAFRIRTPADLDDAAASPADAVLLDNGYGTGEVFDWTLARDFERPFYLAGGLTPENIPDAVRTLHPALVDLSSGVETAGYKDPAKIRAAVKAAHTS
ncbi:MAG: phosphoribosylanthranilate isomerase [Eubacterium sp.]|nr:phosphoribosylanthranilate isomerase [Eubacterium sp.]